MSLIVLYFQHSTSELSFYIDVVLALSIKAMSQRVPKVLFCIQILLITFFKLLPYDPGANELREFRLVPKYSFLENAYPFCMIPRHA